MDAIKYLAGIKSVTDLVALHQSPDFDAADPSTPLNVALEELLDRADVQGSHFGNALTAVVERAAEGQLNRQELIELERQWVELREPLEAFEYGEDAFDRALIDYEERALSRHREITSELAPELGDDLDFER